MNSPGPSHWKNAPLRMANMFEDQGTSYGAEDGPYANVTLSESTPASEDDSHTAQGSSRPAVSKAAMTRVAKACLPCSTKKRRCDGGETASLAEFKLPLTHSIQSSPQASQSARSASSWEHPALMRVKD